MLVAAARAQNFGVNYSVDHTSTMVGVFDSAHGLFIAPSDILLPPAPTRAPAFGPLPPPAINIKGGVPSAGAFHLALATHPGCYGSPAGSPCPSEVDAIDMGASPPVLPGQPFPSLYFSTDWWAFGVGLGTPPSIATESPVGDLACDVLSDLGLGLATPLPPFAGANVGSISTVDGDGLVSGSGFVSKGLGLREPSFPGMVLGDNLDALAFSQVPPPGNASVYPATGVYYSLDASFPDPLTGAANTGTALANGFVGGDVLWQPGPNLPPLLYAPAVALGLDLGGIDIDDLDALVVWENGTPGFQPSQQPFDWAGGATDMVLFSVRRGSWVVGMPDSIFGLPINPGDILTAPLSFFNGGLSPFPGIFVAAENLGLGAFGPGRTQLSPIAFGDELDALEMGGLLNDCDGNGIGDALDIANNTHTDFNSNGVPDLCEPPFFTSFCFCPPAVAPCGNFDLTAGCRNSTGQGALMAPSGSNSVGADNLVLTTTQMPTNKQCINFCSQNLSGPIPFYDGLRCLQGPLARFNIKNTGASGQVSYGPGLAAYSIGNFPIFNWIVSGSTFGFQTWYRDPAGPCSQFANVSNAVQVLFIP